MLCELSMLIL